ncbi:hypothetical protein MMC31_005723 [Peltigera leucophlebia]|nr:hypothetical protein [Peltigera leucophlebia]
MAVTTRRRGALPGATATATLSQGGRGGHSPARTPIVAPRGSGRNRGPATGSTAGTPRQRRNDPVDEGEIQEDEGRRDAKHNHEMQRERIAAELTANRATTLPLQGQVTEEEVRMILAIDQEIKKLEDKSNEILLRIAELEKERQLRIEEARQEQGPAVVQGQAFGREKFDHVRVQRGGPGRIEPQVATPPAHTRGGVFELHTAPTLQDPPESWYQHTPHLSRTAARLLYWGLEQKPLESYSTAYQSYLQECELQGYPHPFPATLQSLASWVSALAGYGMLHRTIKSYLVNARSAQDEIGASREELEVFSHPILERILDGIRNLEANEG